MKKKRRKREITGGACMRTRVKEMTWRTRRRRRKRNCCDKEWGRRVTEKNFPSRKIEMLLFFSTSFLFIYFKSCFKNLFRNYFDFIKFKKNL